VPPLEYLNGTKPSSIFLNLSVLSMVDEAFLLVLVSTASEAELIRGVIEAGDPFNFFEGFLVILLLDITLIQVKSQKRFKISQKISKLIKMKTG
jgi:hypothetical protein